MTEMQSLRSMLDEEGIEYVDTDIEGQRGVWCATQSSDWHEGREATRRWSVVCHPYSYGGNLGLLEYWDGTRESDTQGWLDAEEAMQLIRERIE